MNYSSSLKLYILSLPFHIIVKARLNSTLIFIKATHSNFHQKENQTKKKRKNEKANNKTKTCSKKLIAKF